MLIRVPRAEPLEIQVSQATHGTVPKKNLHNPALGAVGGVADGEQNAGEGPSAAEAGSEDGVLEPGDEEGAEEGGQVLGEVVVGALSCFLFWSERVPMFECFERDKEKGVMCSYRS